MAHNFTITFPQVYTHDLSNTFSMLSQRMFLIDDIDPSFVCKSARDSKGNIIYYIYPKAIDRIETAPHSRKFPVVLYDIREIETIREDNTEFKQIDIPHKSKTQNTDELPALCEEENSISLGETTVMNDDPISIQETLKSSSNDPNLSYNGTYTTITDMNLGFSLKLLISDKNIVQPFPNGLNHLPLPMKINVELLVKEILKKNAIQISSLQISSDKTITLSFSCSSSVSEVVLEQLENIGLDSWFGSIYVTSCDLYKSATTEDSVETVSNSVSDRLILVQEMINLINDGATCTFDYILLLLAAGFMAAVGLACNSSVVVVASMLVSPLMGPILGIAFAAVVHDRELLKRSLRSEIIGILLCFVCGIVVGVLGTPFSLISRGNIWPGWPTAEMVNRGDPYNLILGFLIALPSGVGVALAISGRNTSSLVGVAISASLLPPCVNSGLLWGYALCGSIFHKLATGVTAGNLAFMGLISFCLCAVNIITIVFVGMIMFKVKELVKVSNKSTIWSEDIKAIRKNFDSEHKHDKSIELQSISKTYQTVNVVPNDTIRKTYTHSVLSTNIHRTVYNTTLDNTLRATVPQGSVNLLDLFKKNVDNTLTNH